MADYNINITAQDNTKGAFSSIDKGLAGLGISAGKVKATFAAAAGAFAISATIGKVTETIDSMDNLAKSARTAGAAASNEAFQGFQVMKQAMNEAGIDAGTFDRAMLQTTTRLKAGTEGQKSFAKITDKLGDSLLDMNGNLKSGPELLKEMMNALNSGKITTEEFAKVVGGRAGPLIQQQFASLNTTAEALEGTLGDVAKNSNIVSLDAAENAEVFNDNIGRLKEGMGQLLTDAITPLLPHLVRLSEDIMAKLPAIVEKVQGAFETLQPVFSLIGTVLTDLVFPIMSKVFEVLGHIATAIAPLVESAIPGLRAAFDSLVAIVKSIVEFFQGVATSLQNIFDKAMQLKDNVVGTFDSMGDAVKNKTKEMTDGVKGFFGDMYEKVVGGSIVPDMVRDVLREFERMEQGMVETTKSATTEAADGIQDFADTLVSALDDGKITLSDFEGFFKRTMTNILTEALSSGGGISNAFSGIFGAMGGMFGGGGGGSFISSAISGISSFFGGFFSQGGYLSAGKVGIVGESGPELISGPANITPMDEAGGTTQVVFNINAIDTQTGTQFLLDNKKQIEGIIQNAYTRRGRQGIY